MHMKHLHSPIFRIKIRKIDGCANADSWQHLLTPAFPPTKVGARMQKIPNVFGYTIGDFYIL